MFTQKGGPLTVSQYVLGLLIEMQGVKSRFILALASWQSAM